MSETRSGYDEQLPWLEAVDDEDGPSGVPARRMLGALLIVLLAAAIVSATFFWLGRQNAVVRGGTPELIRAERGPYKVRPSNPGGLDVAGESQTAFETSAGQDTDAQLDLGAVPEQPVARPNSARPDPKRIPPGETREPVQEQQPAATPTGARGSVIQLGAFANRAQAERAWSALSARFSTLGSMNKMIVPFSGGIRLRAGAPSPEQARQMCQTLKVAGENCFVAN
jgi:hypothetical protein